MARSRKTPDTAAGFDPAALDAMLDGRKTMAELDDLFRRMKKSLMERVLTGELTHHLGYAKGGRRSPPSSPIIAL